MKRYVIKGKFKKDCIGNNESNNIWYVYFLDSIPDWLEKDDIIDIYSLTDEQMIHLKNDTDFVEVD